MAATLRTALVLVVAAMLVFAAGCTTCETCPPRTTAGGAATSTGQCVELAPPAAKAAPPAAEEGRGAAEARPPGVQVAPGPSVRAAVPRGPVPPGMYRVQRGDTLWKISARAYGDPYKWRDIYQANRSKISNPNVIYPLQEIQIPKVG